MLGLRHHQRLLGSMVPLSDAMDALVSVGAEFSNVTLLASLTLVTSVPADPSKARKGDRESDWASRVVSDRPCRPQSKCFR